MDSCTYVLTSVTYVMIILDRSRWIVYKMKASYICDYDDDVYLEYYSGKGFHINYSV
jgi:hypothetical protein